MVVGEWWVVVHAKGLRSLEVVSMAPSECAAPYNSVCAVKQSVICQCRCRYTVQPGCCGREA